MATIGTAYVQILPTTKGLASNLQNEMSGAAEASAKSFGGKFSSVAKKVFAMAGIAEVIGKSITEGAKLQQSLGGIETLFKSSADIVIKNADRAWKTAGVSANTYMEQATSFSASLLQSLGGDTEKAAKYADMAIRDMADNSNKMGTSMTDIQNAYQGFAKNNYTMLDNLKLGYGGTKEEMQRLLDHAEKLPGALGQDYDINNLSDVYEAIHLVQQEMGITGTTSKEAATTLSGSFSAMRAAAQNFMGNLALGRDIGPSLDALVETVTTFLFNNLIPAIGNIAKNLPGAIAGFIQTGLPVLISKLAGLIPQIIEGMANSISGMAGKIIEAVNRIGSDPGMAKAGVTAVLKFIAGMLSGIGNLVGAVGQLIGAILTALSLAVIKMGQKGVQAAKEFGGKLLSAGKKAVKGAMDTIKGVIEDVFQRVINFIKRTVQNIANALKFKNALSTVKSVFNSIKTAIQTAINKARSVVSTVVNAIKKYLSFSTIAGKVRGAFNSVKEAITKPIQSARETLSGIVEKIKGFFPIRLGKILSGISLPHINIGSKSKKFFGKEIKVPTFSISWNKQGGIINGATLIGAGEAGPEAIVPLSGKQARPFAKTIAGEIGSSGNTFNITLNASSQENPEQFAQRFARELKRQVRMGTI